MQYLIALACILIFIAVIVWLSYRVGKYKAEKRQAQKNAEQMEKDNKVGAKPYIDKPFRRMHPPED